MSEDQIGLLAPDKLLTMLPLTLGFAIPFLAGLGIDIWLLARIPTIRATLAARAPALRHTPWSWREAFLLALLALLLNLLASFAVLSIERLTGSDAASLSMTLLIQTAWVPLCILALVRAMLLRHGTTWTAAFGLAPRRFAREMGRAILLLLALFPPLVLTAIVAQFVLTRLHIPVERQFVVNILTDPNQPVWLRAYLCVAATLVAPVVEEIAFRGILLPALARSGRWVLAAGVVAMLFAAAHFNLVSLLPLFVLAFGLSLAYMESGSLWLPILMHSLFNAASLAALLLATHYLEVP